ncbi:MAG TPA: hypothetical protein VJV40_01020 [Thermodesulfobacteriota bacterium]|jgi:hypothetical protein|nr:hypothetical protein [Thermodesulfobacteriota bacterium]
MLEMIVTVLSRFIQSYSSMVLRLSKDWFILFKIVFIPVSLYIYCLTFLVIVTVLLIVVVIAFPLSFLSKLAFRQ